MKPKRKLKRWVKIALLFFPVAVLIVQLFLIDLKLRKIINAEHTHYVTCEVSPYGWCCEYE